MKLLLSFTAAAMLFGMQFTAQAQNTPPNDGVKIFTDIAYKTGDNVSEYEKQRCKLDVYLPGEKKGFATLIWLHGGGLTEGDKAYDKAIAHSLAKGGVAVIAANYRLSPQAKYPAYVQDAAAAFAWTRAHIADYGGDTRKLFLGGHSAGGYLALMVGLDSRYAREVGTNSSAVAGLIPISAQTMTHYTVRGERGIGQFSVTADEAAPVFYGRKDTPPMLVLYADHDATARAEENAYFVAQMQGAGNGRVSGRLIHDRDHGSIASHIAEEADPARLAILDFITAEGQARERTATNPAAAK